MTDKELKRLSRAELLEMLHAQVKENESLKERLDEMRAQLDEKKIVIEEAGSIAKASLQLNGVFQAAESAAEQYLENIRRINEEKEAACQKIEAEAKEKAEAVRRETEAACQKMEAEAKEKAETVRREAEAVRKEADSYSSQTRSRVEQYLRETEKKVQELLGQPDSTSSTRHSRRRGERKNEEKKG